MRLASKVSSAIGVAVVIALTACTADARPRRNHHYRHNPDAYGYNYADPGAVLFRGSNGDWNSFQQRSMRSYDVYDIRGHYIGSDPDATVRSQLSHDPSQGRD